MGMNQSLFNQGHLGYFGLLNDYLHLCIFAYVCMFICRIKSKNAIAGQNVYAVKFWEMLPSCPIHRHKNAERLSKASWPTRLTFKRQSVYLPTVICQYSFLHIMANTEDFQTFSFLPISKIKNGYRTNLHSFPLIFLKLYIPILKSYLHEFFCGLLVYVLYFWVISFFIIYL